MIVVFQAKMEEREVQPIWHDADLTSTTLKVKDTDFTFVKEYPAPNYKRKYFTEEYGNSAIQLNSNFGTHAMVATEISTRY